MPLATVHTFKVKQIRQQVEIYWSPQLIGASTLIGRQMTYRSGEPFVCLWLLGGVISAVRALCWNMGHFDDIWGPLLLWGALVAALEALSAAVSGCKGSIRAMASPSKSKYRGPTYILVPPLKPHGSYGPAWAPIWARFSVRFQGLLGRIRVLGTNKNSTQDKPGPSRTNQDPAERIWAPLNQPEPCGAKQGPAWRVRTPGRIGSRETSQGPQKKNQRTVTDQGPAGRTRASLDESGPRETEQGPVRRSRAPRDEPDQGPAVRIRVIWDGSGPRRTSQYPGMDRAPRNVSMSYGTNQGPAGRIRGPSGQTRTQRYESGWFGTDRGLQDQSRPRDGSGPAEHINVLRGLARALQYE